MLKITRSRFESAPQTNLAGVSGGHTSLKLPAASSAISHFAADPPGPLKDPRPRFEKPPSKSNRTMSLILSSVSLSTPFSLLPLKFGPSRGSRPSSLTDSLEEADPALPRAAGCVCCRGVIKVISSGYQHRQPSPGERASPSKVEINHESFSP